MAVAFLLYMIFLKKNIFKLLCFFCHVVSSVSEQFLLYAICAVHNEKKLELFRWLSIESVEVILHFVMKNLYYSCNV